MHSRLRHFALGTVLAFGLTGCSAGAAEPSEAQMKDNFL